jgi:GNAT superfamily N-acetyltransferase
LTTNPEEHALREVLMDGSTVSLRRLRSGDFDEILRLSETLTDDERYLRFSTVHPSHLEAWARSLTECPSNQYALGAFDSGKLIGVANYVMCQPGSAEVAVVVAHDQHLRGVGTALLRQLGSVARRNGLHHFVAEVLAENYLMLRVMCEASWPATRHLDGSVFHVEINLDDAQ